MSGSPISAPHSRLTRSSTIQRRLCQLRLAAHVEVLSCVGVERVELPKGQITIIIVYPQSMPWVGSGT